MAYRRGRGNSSAQLLSSAKHPYSNIFDCQAVLVGGFSMVANPVTPTPELQIETEATSAETIFRCAGELTSSTATQFRDCIHKEIRETHRIVLDLTKVSCLDSAGLGALVGLWVSAKRVGCNLKLVSLSQRIKELCLTSLDKLFAISRFPDKPSF